MLNDDLLLGVQKPARYIGSEWNVAKKDFDKANIKFALCFPDLYEVGMSNLGIRILYSLINKIEDAICERFFAPDIDMEKVLRNSRRGIFSLESQRELREFDIIGFSLGYELGYTNVLNILDLGGIPLVASQRQEGFPLVIAGGPCVLNPEPMAEFFDLFILGEGEEVIIEIIDVYRKFKSDFKSSKLSKEDLLIILSGIEGVYVPSFYEPRYNSQSKIEEFKPKVSNLPVKIKKRIVKSLDNAYFPSDWLVPYIQIVHDRITLEIMRGCPNRCRFCQAKAQYFPMRQRQVKNLLNLADELYKRSGYEEISLLGLSVSDYSRLKELLDLLISRFKEKAISVSLPSVRPKTILGELTDLISTIKKTALTFAPEAATEQLRRTIGKDFSEEDFLKTAEAAYSSGYQHIKLYFMIGLPYEEKSDLVAVLEFARNVSELRRKIKGYPAQINISINTLIPKPHTPLQWFEMLSLDEIKNKQDYLKKNARNKRLKLSFHNRFMSFLEGVFSRGDRRLSEVILSAFKKGARFDGWGDYFEFNKWIEAFRECNIEPDFYIRQRRIDEILPWDFLDVGISKKELIAEFNKVVARK
jgi:radical SAM family uncharacterized protein